MNLTRTLLASALVALLAACSNGAQDGQKSADEAPQSAATAPADQAAPSDQAASAASAPDQAADSGSAAATPSDNGG